MKQEEVHVKGIEGLEGFEHGVVGAFLGVFTVADPEGDQEGGSKEGCGLEGFLLLSKH